MFAFPPRYDSYEEYQHERLKREEYRRDYEKRESERAEQREKQRQKAMVSRWQPTPRACAVASSEESMTCLCFYYRQISNQINESEPLIACGTLLSSLARLGNSKELIREHVDDISHYRPNEWLNSWWR